MFFAYIGFDAISTAAEETTQSAAQPADRHLGGLAICTLIYVIVGVVLTGMVPYKELAVADPLARALQLAGFNAVGWVQANDACRLDILDRLRAVGAAAVARASGHLRGAVAVDRVDQQPQRHPTAGIHGAARRGRDRRPRRPRPAVGPGDRVYPDDPVVAGDEALRMRNERRLRALGIARARGPECPVEPVDVGEAGEPAVVEGVKGAWRVDPAQLGQPFSGRAALLSPFDRLVHDRKRMVELFEFDYQLEMYKPAAKRRWGYFALPILYGDRLVGKLDATADRKAGVLRVDAIHQDVPFTTAMTAAVDREIKDLARWLELDLDRADRADRAD